MNIKSKIGMVLATTLVLSGCAGLDMRPEAKSKPDTLVSGYSQTQVKDMLVAYWTNQGFFVSHSSDYGVAFDKRSDSVVGQVLFGSRYDRKPAVRYNFTLVPQGEKVVRVVGDIGVVTNPGSAYEQVQPMNGGKDSDELQRVLDSMQEGIDGYYARKQYSTR